MVAVVDSMVNDDDEIMGVCLFSINISLSFVLCAIVYEFQALIILMCSNPVTE